jgi:lipopolysaccharide transport system ATP-binding protein
MSQPAIRVENLSKQYLIAGLNREGRSSQGSLRDTLAEVFASSFRRVGKRWRGEVDDAVDMLQTIWALKEVSFEVNQGEVVGIIGRNGAGKSTLLKLLSRIMEPTAGEATIYGRVGSLLEVGTGFHPELTGRENIYLNGAILGMRRAEIERKFDEIVAFAELEKFIDTPVKHYSSGMYMRLAFAVAAHLESEILLLDEALAVGDTSFQKKCLGKMDDAAKGGRTVLLVSHDLSAVAALAQRSLYLKHGQLQADGFSQEVIRQYMSDLEAQTQTSLGQRTDRLGEGHVHLTNLRWLDAKTMSPLAAVMSGQEVYLEVSYAATSTYQKPINSLFVNIDFRTQLKQYVMSLNSRMANGAFECRLPASGRLYCHLERFPLMVGRYICDCNLKVNGIHTDRVYNALIMDVEAGDFFGTGFAPNWNVQGVYVPHTWSSEVP